MLVPRQFTGARTFVEEQSTLPPRCTYTTFLLGLDTLQIYLQQRRFSFPNAHNRPNGKLHSPSFPPTSCLTPPRRPSNLKSASHSRSSTSSRPLKLTALLRPTTPSNSKSPTTASPKPSTFLSTTAPHAPTRWAARTYSPSTTYTRNSRARPPPPPKAARPRPRRGPPHRKSLPARATTSPKQSASRV